MDGHEFEQTLGDSEGQGGLECCSLWGRKESNMTGQLKDNNKEIVASSVQIDDIGPHLNILLI